MASQSGLRTCERGRRAGWRGLKDSRRGLRAGQRGFEDQPVGRHMYLRKDKWTDGRTEFHPILQDFGPCRGRRPKTILSNKTHVGFFKDV